MEDATSQQGVTVVRRSERRRPAQATPGMQREEVFAGTSTWIGTVRTAPGVETGWHHHGAYESYVYVLSGSARMEFGPDGAEGLDCEPGDVIHVAPGVIHREITTGSHESEAILFRVGSGPVTFNVDGPESGAQVPDAAGHARPPGVGQLSASE